MQTTNDVDNSVSELYVLIDYDELKNLQTLQRGTFASLRLCPHGDDARYLAGHVRDVVQQQLKEVNSLVMIGRDHPPI